MDTNRTTGTATEATAGTMTWIAIMNSAADLIAERGLAHGHFQDENGRFCAQGAMYFAACGEAVPENCTDHPSFPTAQEAISKFAAYLSANGLSAALDPDGNAYTVSTIIAHYNNPKERTADEMAQHLRVCASHAERS